jgi:hypothetical protein
MCLFFGYLMRLSVAHMKLYVLVYRDLGQCCAGEDVEGSVYCLF